MSTGFIKDNSSSFPWITKAPGEALTYSLLWNGTSDQGGPWLASGETITGGTWVVTAGLTKGTETNTANTTSVKLSGGQAGNTYLATCTATTSAGNTVVRTLEIRVEDR